MEKPINNHREERSVTDGSSAIIASQFRVLVVDNESDILIDAGDQLGDLAWCELLTTRTQRGALSILDERHVDAAVVDLELDVAAGGLDVLRQMARRAPRSPILVATKHVDPEHTRQLLTFVGLTTPRVVRVLDKQHAAEDWVRDWVGDVAADWHDSAVTVQNLELPVEMLWNKRRRVPKIRAEAKELGTEVERLCRALFGRARIPRDETPVELDFRAIARTGLSAAITLEVHVRLGRDTAGEPVPGTRCIVKMGPSELVAGEVERYNRFVRHGVPLTHRVELLGYASEQALGAVCYSFAGNVFGVALTSLDELFHHTEHTALAKLALGNLFDLPAKQWYSVQCRPVASRRYVASTHEMEFDGCYTRLDKSLKKLSTRLRERLSYHRVDESDDGVLQGPDWKVVIPRKDLLGYGQFMTRRLPACLVHGDMHGGNVMVELANDLVAKDGEGTPKDMLRRVCLIDYGSAGPGPRCVDFIAVEASLRLADAAGILEAASGGTDEERLSDAQLGHAIDVAGRRVPLEIALMKELWRRGPDESLSADDHWAALSGEIIRLVRRNFCTITSEEYATVAIPWALRQLGFAIGHVGRVRMLAWLTALYELNPSQRGAEVTD